MGLNDLAILDIIGCVVYDYLFISFLSSLHNIDCCFSSYLGACTISIIELVERAQWIEQFKREGREARAAYPPTNKKLYQGIKHIPSARVKLAYSDDNQ